MIYLAVLLVVGIILYRLRSQAGFTISPEAMQQQGFESVLLVAVLVATGGMVSTDVHNGFYRAWFSKPIAPWWYYLQRWLLGGLLLMLAPVVLGVILVVIHGEGTGITLSLMATLALGYLLIGSMVLLLSTWSRLDWLMVFLLASAQGALTSIRQFGGVEFSRTLEAVYQAMPPFHLIDPTQPMLSGRPLLHVVAYGAGMLVLALLLLTTRPLGSGGRA
jgi:hypothetical protein